MRYFIHIEPTNMLPSPGIEATMKGYLEDTWQHRITSDIADVYYKIKDEVNGQNRFYSEGLFLGLCVLTYLDQNPPRLSIVWQSTKRQAFHIWFYPIIED